MMISIVREAGGVPDIHVIDGLIQFVDGEEEIRQHLEIRMAIWRGEVFYDLDEGVDYADLVFPAEDRAEVTGELRRVALGTPGVQTATLDITSESPEKIAVQGSYTASVGALNDLIRAEFGPVEVSGG